MQQQNQQPAGSSFGQAKGGSSFGGGFSMGGGNNKPAAPSDFRQKVPGTEYLNRKRASIF